jgi:DNA primase
MTGRPRTTREARPSPEARQEKLEALHERLAQQVEALRSGDDWQRWLSVAARFPTYSFANTILILAQRPGATAVAGYQAWRTLGRQVNKGERGIQILAPVFRRDTNDKTTDLDSKTDPSAESTTGRSLRRLVGFRPAHVWDVSQTSGDPLPEPPPIPTPLRGEAPPGLWDRVAGEIGRRGFRLERGDTGDANGWTDARQCAVRIAESLDDAHAVRTLVHELAHVALHCRSEDDEPPRELPACRGLIEVEAESVAYLVCTSYGMSADDYTFPYVAGWVDDIPGDNSDAVRATGTRVLDAARHILQRIGETPDLVDTHRLTDRAAQGLTAMTALRRRAEATRQAATTRTVSPLASRRAAQQPPSPQALIDVHEIAQLFYNAQASQSWVHDYLADRSLEALGSPWGAGYAPRRWRALTAHLSRAGISERLLLASGLVTRSRNGSVIDRFRDRLMLPLRNETGDVIGFIGRAKPGTTGDAPKYLNSPDTALYSKHQYLYGRYEARQHLHRGARPVLVEGPLDAIAVTTGTGGRCVGLATCGTAVTEAHITALVNAAESPSTLVVATDADTAGRRAAERALLLLERRGIDPLAPQLLPAIDPADILRREGPAALTAALTDRAQPLADQVIGSRLSNWQDRLHWAEGRVNAVRDVAPLVAQLPPAQATRQVHRIATYVGTDTGLVLAEVMKHVGVQARRPPATAAGPPTLTGGHHRRAR